MSETAQNPTDEKVSLRKYLCHKIVEAGKIRSVEKFEDYAQLTVLYLGGPNEENIHKQINVSLEWDNKFSPEKDKYLVRYNDGYLSCSPKEAFEEGYTLVLEEEEMITVSLKRYKELRNAEYELECLNCAGVDNWDGRDFAYEDWDPPYPDLED